MTCPKKNEEERREGRKEAGKISNKRVEEAGMKYPKLDLDEYRLSRRARFSLKAIRPDDVQGWDKATAKARLNENLVA